MAMERISWRGRAILHIDMDAFFASIEQLDDPRLRGRPVIVGGDPSSRGVVATASYEARASGVRSAMASATAARLCPDAVWVRPRFERYREVAEDVRRVLYSVTPLVEISSIDEAYLDVSPGQTGEDPVEQARTIAGAVRDMALSCSIGVATSKTVAKIASDQRKPGGLVVVWPGEEAEFLAPLPVRVLPGIGPAAQKRLARLGISTLGEFGSLDEASAVCALGSFGPVAVLRARGIDPRPVVTGRPVKSVSNEATFPADLALSEAVQRLEPIVAKVASRLRARGLAGRTLIVKVRYADMTTRSAQTTLEQPTDLEEEMLPLARELLASLLKPGARVRLVGFGVSGLGEPIQQMALFDVGRPAAHRERTSALERKLDEIRERFGADAVHRGLKDRRKGPQGS